jgi:hypothetical protein
LWCFSRRIEHAKFMCLEHPTFLVRHLIRRLSLVDVHHSHWGAVSLVAAGRTEMSLGRVLNRQAWRFLLLVLLPTLKLLAGDQGD